MTLENAYKIINPDTAVEALEEIRNLKGFNEEKVSEVVKEALRIACYCMGKDMPKKPERIDNDPDCDIVYYRCPTCGVRFFSYADDERCKCCGQILKR